MAIEGWGIDDPPWILDADAEISMKDMTCTWRIDNASALALGLAETAENCGGVHQDQPGNLGAE